MSYAHLADRLFNTPLLIAPDKADTIAAVFNAHLTNTQKDLPPYEAPTRVDLAASMSMRRAEGGYYVTNAGVALVPAHGSFVQRAGMFDSLSGLTGYNSIAAALSAAVRDHVVSGVVMEFDSAGGEVEGVVDLASLIASVDKPVWAHANGIALSAAYWLSAAADRVYASQTGLVGSIGCLMLHADRSKIIERSGVVYTAIYAGARKLDGSSMAPLSEEARTRAQARVDQVYAMFVEHVAAHRDVTDEAVRETEAAIMSVQDAIKVGLADDVASLGDTIQMMTDDLNAGRSKRKGYGRAAASAQSQQENAMTDKVNQPAAATNQPAAITQEQLDAAKAAGIAEGKAAATVDAQALAETAAQARIAGILDHAEAKGRDTLAKHLAFKTKMTVDDAAAALAAAPKEAAPAPSNLLAAAMAKIPNPNVGAGAGEDGEETAEAVGKRMAATVNKPRLSAVK